jgi:asparagine synthetase B (glutamine-hydrolysing)
MQSPSSRTNFVGLAGVFPYMAARDSILNWNILPILDSSSLKQNSSALLSNKLLLEQFLHPFLELQTSQTEVYNSMLRVAICGTVRIGTQELGHDDNMLSHLHALQKFLDLGDSPRFGDLDGDFSITYLPPDRSCCFIYRSVVGTRSVYYRFLKNHFLWSTNPTDLFLNDRPSISSIDIDLLPALTVAGDICPSRTCYHDIQKIPSGYCLQVLCDGSYKVSIDDFVVRDHTDLELSEAVNQLRLLIGTAVHKKLAGFSKVGILLSGGFDSAVAAFEAAKVTESVTGIHWNWKELSILRDEQIAAQSVASRLGIELTVKDFSDSIGVDGDYLKCMSNPTVPFTNSFFHCFLNSAVTANELGISVIASGHLGDTLFQGHWSDPILAKLMPAKSPLTLMKTFCALVARHGRSQAIQDLWQLLQLDKKKLQPEENPRIELGSVWLTPEALEKAQKHGRHRYYRELSSISSESVYQNIKQGINGEQDTGVVTNAFSPQGVALVHPFADRALIEFCLGLGVQHRACFHAEETIQKLTLRLAYVQDIPQRIIGRDIRSPYVAVSESYCRNNSSELIQLLGKESLLAELGVIDSKHMFEMLSNPQTLQRYGPALIRVAGVEMWLKFLDSGGKGY